MHSQKKDKVLKIDNIYIDVVKDIMKDIDMYLLVTHTNWGEVELGRYESHARAFEILDSIRKSFEFEIHNKSYKEAELLIKAQMLPKVVLMPEN